MCLNKRFFSRGNFKITVLEVGGAPTYFKFISYLNLSFFYLGILGPLSDHFKLFTWTDTVSVKVPGGETYS